MNVRVYNTLSRKKELLQPVEAGKVGIYLCGPTVYKESHIGHMVGPVVFDTIKRYLTYCGLSVNWVVNITDVDDKKGKTIWIDNMELHCLFCPNKKWKYIP